MWKWFKKMTTWAKTATVIAGTVVSVAGGIAVYNNWIIGRHEANEDMEMQSQEFRELQQNFDLVMDSIGSLSRQVRVVDTKVDRVNTKADYLLKSDDNLKQFMLDHAVSTEEVLEIIEIWDIKKNGRENLGEIVSDR
jgi:methyl-accepting chemotaxis protein